MHSIARKKTSADFYAPAAKWDTKVLGLNSSRLFDSEDTSKLKLTL